MNVKKTAVFSALVLIAALLVGTYFPVHGEAEIYDKVLRLHVLANSDSEEDQALKLKVRDEIVKYFEDFGADCADIDEMKAKVGASLGEISEIAQAVVISQGYTYPVSVSLGTEKYPTRSYESMCFPSGNYLSLRIMIGEAKGQNWWCVLFPPLCLGAAGGKSDKQNENAFISAGLTDDQYKLVTETDNAKYKARFKILELISSYFS